MYKYNPDFNFYYSVFFYSKDLTECVGTEMRIEKFEYLLFRYDKQVRETNGPVTTLTVILPFEKEDMRHIVRLICPHWYTTRWFKSIKTDIEENMNFESIVEDFLNFISFNKLTRTDLVGMRAFRIEAASLYRFNTNLIVYRLEEFREFIVGKHGWKFCAFVVNIEQKLSAANIVWNKFLIKFDCGVCMLARLVDDMINIIFAKYNEGILEIFYKKKLYGVVRCNTTEKIKEFEPEDHELCNDIIECERLIKTETPI